MFFVFQVCLTLIKLGKSKFKTFMRMIVSKAYIVSNAYIQREEVAIVLLGLTMQKLGYHIAFNDTCTEIIPQAILRLVEVYLSH